MPTAISIGLWLVSALSCMLFAWRLRRASVFQKIYELSPESHQKKGITPSMGGAIFIPLIILSTAFLTPLTPPIIWLLVLCLGYAGIGFWDDLASLKKNENKGLTARKKFLLQNGLGVVMLLGFHIWVSPLNAWEWPLYLFILSGTSNATNLTDGLDGLLAGLSLITFWGFHVLAGAELSSMALIVVVVMAGFLMVNHHPAKLFMGDTGSLALGALMAGMAIVMRDAFILIPLGAVYILETLSVMVQVAYFKRTKKRIFLMSPLHHHFELMGLSETTVVRLFWALGLSFLMLYVGLSA